MEENTRLCPNCSATVDQDAINCPQCGVGLPQAENLTEQISETVSDVKDGINDTVEGVGENLTDVASDIRDKAEEIAAPIEQQSEPIRDSFITDPHEEKLPDPFAQPVEFTPHNPADPHETTEVPGSSIPAYTPKPREAASAADPLPTHNAAPEQKTNDKKWLWIILIVLAVLILCICGFAMFIGFFSTMMA